MEHRPTPNPPAPPVGAAAPPPPPHAGLPLRQSSRAHWTPARQRIFLVALLDSGSVALAARAAGMSRSSAHRLRARLTGTPFARMWDQALVEHARRLADPFAPDPAAAPQPRVPGASPAAL